MDDSKVKKIGITAKCSDLCYTALYGDDGEILADHDGYVPGFMPGQHYGDYIELEIDPATGIILNWDKTRALTLFADLQELKE